MNFANRAEFFDWLDGVIEADRTPGEARARSIFASKLLYEGVQWVQNPSGNARNLRRLGQDIRQANPDKQNLRVTLNIITRGVELVEAQTFPSRIGFECQPMDFGADPESEHRANVFEHSLDAVLKDAKFLAKRRQANFRRSVDGVSGLILCADYKERELEVRGKRRASGDRRYSVKLLDPTKLIVDPATQERDLSDHEYIVYRDVWSLDKIRRVYGVDLKEDDAKTFGDIVPMHVEMAHMTDGRLFGAYANYSTTPAAIVYQVHWKDDSGRFANMAVVIEPAQKDDRIWVNEDDHASPFGGTGLPMVMYHGVPRSESMWSISDVQKMRDAQHLRNIAESFLLRHLQNSSSFKVMFDERGLPNGVNHDAFRQSWDNRIGGVHFYSSANSTTGRPIPPPSIMQMPTLPPGVMEMSDRYAREGSEQIHRTAESRGVTKSHVPDATVQAALDRANLPLDKRVEEDREVDRQFAEMAMGTMAREVHARNPSTLAALTKVGIGADEIAVILRTDPDAIGVEITVRESAVRARSHESRRADLNAALQAQAITPQQYQLALATDLDSPLSESDRLHVVQARKAAMRVAMGEEWAPIPLGERTPIYIAAFVDALVSERASRDPAMKERLSRAIDAQEQYEFMRAMSLNPEAMQQAPQSAEPVPTEPRPMTVGDLLGAAGGV